MRRRSLLICLTIACIAMTALGASVSPAVAEQRVFTVTLADGTVLPMTLEIEPGAPLSSIKLPPEYVGLIASVSDGVTTVSGQDLAPATPPEQPEEAPPADATTDTAPGVGATIEPDEPEAEVETSPGTGAQIQAGGTVDPDKGKPDRDDPTYSYALPGPSPIGVPNFFIDRFRIPPFLLPIYQAAGVEYGIRWEILAAINEIETDYGRNTNVSSAGAQGWMQFMPATWKTYGVDANDDGEKDPYNPVDAIFSAARYLRAAGGDKDLERAIFAYNHADWYVDSVMLRAKLIAGMPTDLVSSLTGLTQGRFPVAARATYADAITRSAGQSQAAPAESVSSDEGRKIVRLFADAGSDVVAVHDGTITEIGENFIQLEDVYGNSYTYGRLGRVAITHQVPTEGASESPASESEQHGRVAEATPAASGADAEADARRIYANPDLAVGAGTAGLGVSTQPLKVGSHVVAGTVLGTIGKTTELAPHVEFSIRPAGRGAPKIDPKPILDGWKLLETTALYRAADTNPFHGPDAKQPTIGQILLMGKDQLEKRVLDDPRINIYDCGRKDIEAGVIDRRVLATLSMLANSGFEPGVTSLRCGHSRLTASGRVSYHSLGSGVDIATINGTPITGHQGPGSLTDQTVRKLLTLQGNLKPAEIITLMKYDGTDNTYAMADHYDHIHVGFAPLSEPGSEESRQQDATLRPGQWDRLMDRLDQIDNPDVKVKPSEFSIAATAPDRSGRHAD